MAEQMPRQRTLKQLFVTKSETKQNVVARLRHGAIVALGSDKGNDTQRKKEERRAKTTDEKEKAVF